MTTADAPPLRVVIVNDSATMRAALRAALALAPDLEVVAEVDDGARAAAVVAQVRPAIVVMDVVMPGRDGFAATREIMARTPTPIVMVSAAVDVRATDVVLDALGAGALAITEAPPPPTASDYRARAAALAQLLRMMAASRVTRSTVASPSPPSPAATRAAPARATPGAPLPPSPVSAIGVVASTGGPNAVAELLGALPRGVLPPILLVQHIAPGFARGFASWLAERTGHDALVPQDGAALAPGTVYVAPDGQHLGVTHDLRAEVSDAPPVGMFRPSGTHLLRSLANAVGRRALGVVLTGMGDDGADGAVALRRAGGRVVAQDETTSVIYGMPRSALERGGVDEVLPLGEIARWLCVRTNR